MVLEEEILDLLNGATVGISAIVIGDHLLISDTTDTPDPDPKAENTTKPKLIIEDVSGFSALDLGIAGEVAGGIAHAIYNPLAALIGHMEMKLDSDKVDPRDEHVMHLARRIEAVVEGMLTLSRRGTMRPEPMDLGDLVREVRRELAERCLTQGVEVELRIAPDLPQLTADRALLTTALLSVAENAVDAMEKGGKLVLEVESVSKTAAVRLRVRDSGAGVPAKIRGRIFEPFYSTKPRGVGLGLAIARGIILGHEGSIRLESEPGIGTEVTLEIPQQGVREARR